MVTLARAVAFLARWRLVTLTGPVIKLVPHTGCLLVCRMQPTEITLAILEGNEQHGSMPIRVQIGVQTSRPEPGGHLRWAHDYVSGVGGGRPS